MSISLGCFDSSISQSELNRYKAQVAKYAGHPAGHPDDKLICDTGLKKLRALDTEDISGLQRFLVGSGFFPDGQVDSICGYRTHAAIRLYQEYVRSVEKRNCLPDGIAGPKTLAHVARWRRDQLQAEWSPLLAQWKKSNSAIKSARYGQWLSFLAKVQKHYAKNPTAEIELVNKYRKKTDTRQPADWAYPRDQVHLIGIRRKEQDSERKFDDMFVLLIRGLVFKFQGSTDPGATSNEHGAPFLVKGQHDYRFGLHQGKYHALRPLNYSKHGVLVVRSKGDFKLTDDDLKRGVASNGTINIHWGGKGVGRAVRRWSEGCQVITGSGYEDFRGKPVSCASYVAVNNGDVKNSKGKRSRGAYNVLADILIALGSGLPKPGEVSYTLLNESDCQLDAAISAEISGSLKSARQLMAKLS